MNMVSEYNYEVWSKRPGDSMWTFEAGSNSEEGAMQYAAYIEAKPKVARVRVYRGSEIAYDSDLDLTGLE